MAHPTMDSRGLDAQVADVVRARILAGELAPGEHLVESVLAGELSVSQGTVRSGLRLLQPEGLVTYRPNRGVFVETLSPDDIGEICSLRNALEGLASRLAAERLTDSGRKELTDSLARLRDAVDSGDSAGAVKADREIHETIVRLSGHRRLRALHSSFLTQTSLFMNLARQLHHDLNEVYSLHQPLVEAIVSGDVDRAEDLARHHNTEDGERLSALMSERV